MGECVVKTILAVATASLLLTAVPQGQTPFSVEEATIAQVHAAMKAKRLTCRQLVDAYIDRIARYDKPNINAIVITNPDARREADALDRQFAQRGLTGPLHCVPTIVKDNFETIGMQSADGSLSLAGFVSSKDAFQVKRIKAAGAIVIAKSNMAEFAFSPLETVNSIHGTTHNPYDTTACRLDRAAARRRPWPPASDWSASALTPATRFAVRRPTTRWSAFDRRWASRAGRA